MTDWQLTLEVPGAKGAQPVTALRSREVGQLFARRLLGEAREREARALLSGNATLAAVLQAEIERLEKVFAVLGLIGAGSPKRTAAR